MNNLKLGMVSMNYAHVDVGGNPPIYKSLNSKYLFVKHEFSHTSNYNSQYHQNHDYYYEYVVCAIVNVTKDFDPYSDDLIKIENDTSSFQIRPKLIYKDNKGYFYKPFGKVVRLTELEIKQVNDFIKNNK